MTACTERQSPAADNGLAGEGQKGLPTVGTGMTACTEPDEGQKGLPEGGTA